MAVLGLPTLFHQMFGLNLVDTWRTKRNPKSLQNVKFQETLPCLYQDDGHSHALPDLMQFHRLGCLTNINLLRRKCACINHGTDWSSQSWRPSIYMTQTVTLRISSWIFS